MAEEGERGYDILTRGINPNSGTNMSQLEMVHEESKEESYSKLEFTGKGNLAHNSVGTRETTVGLLETVHEENKEESYSKLEFTGKSNLAHSPVGTRGRSQEYEYNKMGSESDVPRDTNVTDSNCSEENENSEEKELINSSVAKKETSLECDNYHMENSDSEKKGQKEEDPESPPLSSCMPVVAGTLR